MPGLFGYETTPTHNTPPATDAGNDQGGNPPADDQNQQGQDQQGADDQQGGQDDQQGGNDQQDQQHSEPFVTLDDGRTVPVADYVRSINAEKEAEIAVRTATLDERERWLSSTGQGNDQQDQQEEEPATWDPLNMEELVFDTDTERVLATRLNELGESHVAVINENKELKGQLAQTEQRVHDTQYQHTIAKIEDKFGVTAQEIDDFYLQNPLVRDPEIIAEIISSRRTGDEQQQTKTNEQRQQARDTRQSQVSKIGGSSGAPAANQNRPASADQARKNIDPYNPEDIAANYTAFNA